MLMLQTDENQPLLSEKPQTHFLLKLKRHICYPCFPRSSTRIRQYFLIYNSSF